MPGDCIVETKERMTDKTSTNGNTEQQTYAQLVELTQTLSAGLSVLLRKANLSIAQYNVLQILRDAGEDGLCCRDIAELMMPRGPDVTRLLDRLENRGLVAREREQRDRRVVRVHIQPLGQQVLESMDEPVANLHRRQLAALDEDRLHELCHLLESVRSSVNQNLSTGVS